MSVTTRLATMDDYEAIGRLLAQGDAYHVKLVPSIFQPYDGAGRPREFIARFIVTARSWAWSACRSRKHPSDRCSAPGAGR